MDHNLIFGQCRVALETYKISKTLQVPVIFRGGVTFTDDLKVGNLMAIDGWIRLDGKWHRAYMSKNVHSGQEMKYLDGVLIK